MNMLDPDICMYYLGYVAARAPDVRLKFCLMHWIGIAKVKIANPSRHGCGRVGHTRTSVREDRSYDVMIMVDVRHA